MFKIIDISNGWFNFTLNNGAEIFNAECTKYCDIDIAKQLLLLAHSLLYKKSHQIFFCINSENEAYQMKVTSFENKIQIIIRQIKMSPFRLIGSTETSIAAAKVGEPLFIFEVIESIFIENICNEYSNIDKVAYEKNWFDFPHNILKELKRRKNFG